MKKKVIALIAVGQIIDGISTYIALTYLGFIEGSVINAAGLDKWGWSYMIVAKLYCIIIASATIIILYKLPKKLNWLRVSLTSIIIGLSWFGAVWNAMQIGGII